MTRVERKIKEYKKLMNDKNFREFENLCKMSIDLNAKNNTNFNRLDLALYQVDELAKKYI